MATPDATHDQPVEPLLWTESQVCEALNLDHEALHRMIATGRFIAAVEIGVEVRWSVAAVHQWVEILHMEAGNRQAQSAIGVPPD